MGFENQRQTLTAIETVAPLAQPQAGLFDPGFDTEMMPTRAVKTIAINKPHLSSSEEIS
jgi:hypothetical protein